MAISKTPFTPTSVQRALGVQEDGKWGKETEAAARKFLGSTATDWDRARLVVGVQQRMMEQAGIKVEVDGFLGPDTRAAMEQFENMLRSPQPPHPEIGWWSSLFQLGASLTADPPKEVTAGAQPTSAPEGQRPPKIVRTEFPLQRDVPAFYGAVGSHQVLIPAPWPMVLAWDKSTSVKKISLHEKCAASAQRAMTGALAYYGQAGIEKLGLNLYGGSLNVRKMRGGNSWSMHSWGIAIDFDPDRNQLRQDHTTARLAKADAKMWFDIWEAAGWTSLGRARDMDWMHVQAASL